MRAAIASNDGVEFVRLPDPTPGPEEVVIEVAATAMNRADLLQRMGLYNGPTTLPGGIPGTVPGLEFSGRVIANGDRSDLFAVGDAVMGIVAGGAHATHLVVHERQLLPVPSRVALGDAAAIPEVFITAWDALVVQGGLTSGRTALVHAGASGVGTAAIEICNAIGASIIVTASHGKLEACRSLGAHHAIERSPNDWLSEVQALAPNGVDVVLDVVGEVMNNVAAVRVGGRIIQVGVMGAGTVNVNLFALLPKRVGLIGTVLRARPLEEKIAVTRRFAAEVLPLFDRDLLHPVIDSHVAFDNIADAYNRMSANANIGKIVIDVAAR
jgi:putative PIG3 family NAD(P)H quinone oxidoreductase